MVGLELHEVETIGQCLKAVAYGPFLKDDNADDPWWEFHTLIGLDNPELTALAEEWPNVDVGSERVRAAVNNTLNNLLGYPHGLWDEWPRFISASPQEVARALEKWRALIESAGGNSGSRYFDHLM